MESLSYQGVSESRPAMFGRGCGAGVGKNGVGSEEFVAPTVGEIVDDIVGEIVGESVGAADGPFRVQTVTRVSTNQRRNEEPRRNISVLVRFGLFGHGTNVCFGKTTCLYALAGQQ